MHDSFFDDLQEDIFDIKCKERIIPKSSSEKKRDNIQAAIKIRGKFR